MRRSPKTGDVWRYTRDTDDYTDWQIISLNPCWLRSVNRPKGDIRAVGDEVDYPLYAFEAPEWSFLHNKSVSAMDFWEKIK